MVLDTKKCNFGSQERLWFLILLQNLQILLQNATAIFLQNARKVYYKTRQVFITKYNNNSDSYDKMRWFYWKMRQLLQNAAYKLLVVFLIITNMNVTQRLFL